MAEAEAARVAEAEFAQLRQRLLWRSGKTEADLYLDLYPILIP